MRIIFALITAAIVGACTFVPFETGRDVTHAFTHENQNVDRRSALLPELQFGGQDAFFELSNDMDALGARLQMIDAAQSSIDVMTFMIKPDTAGKLFVSKLIEASNRGVRVRFLVDDIFTTVHDPDLAALDLHKNISVRYFNPASRFAPKAMGLVFDFKRINRRMHTKVFIVDNSMAIVGGRNIANEYFRLDRHTVFADYEVLLFGRNLPDLARIFDLFWNDQMAVSASKIIPNGTQTPLSHGLENWDRKRDAKDILAYQKAVASPFLKNIRSGKIKPFGGSATVVVDSPQKLRNPIAKGPHVVAETLFAKMKTARREVILLTPYFVPENYGARFFESLVAKGVRVRIVTNTLAATNHAYVNGGYAPYRKRLLNAGVELYEVRADAPIPSESSQTDQYTRLTMHTKLAVIDDQEVYVGSMNLDPRSIKLNAEIGLFITSPNYARATLASIKENITQYSFKVGVTPQDALFWDYQGAELYERRWHEPGASFLRKLVAEITKVLSIERQL